MTTQTVRYRIKTLYATAAELASANPVLLAGELATESDTGVKKTGNGVTPYNSLLPDSVGTGGVAAYIHNQVSASFTWTINHNLGYRPSVELFNSGSQEFDAVVSHPTVNQTVVGPMSIATSGFARLL